METDDYPTDVTPVNPVTKPAERDKNNRTMVIYKGRRMAHYRAQRIATLEPLINRANSEGMSIPKAAEWLGYSKAALRHWVAILGIRWKRRNHRPRHVLDKSGWEETIKAGLLAGKTQTALAAELGVKIPNICRFIKARGLAVYVKGRTSR